MKICLYTLLAAIVLSTPGGLFGAAASDIDLSKLTAEDQAIVKNLKFMNPEPAPADTRRLSYVKGRFQVINNTGANEVPGKLVVEMRFLCQNRDKTWCVIKLQSDFTVNKKGQQGVNVSFEFDNSELARCNGENVDTKKPNGVYRPKPPRDTYTAVFYNGQKIYEVPGKTGTNFPKTWWKDDSLLWKSKK